MKKHLNFYVSFWAILLAVFNAITFISPGWIEYGKYTPAFWTGYGAIMLAFASNIVFAWFSFYKKNAKQIFYNLAYFRINYIGLITTFVVGGIFMLTTVVQLWICLLVCVIVIGINAIAFVKAMAAAQFAEATENKVQESTTFIKLLRADAKAVAAAAKTEQARATADKICDALQYCDPVSKDVLAVTETELKESFEAFSKMIHEGQDAEEAAQKVLYLIEKRNQQCIALK